MVKIALQLKATLENIEELKPSGPDFSWCLKFTCSNCREVSNWNQVSLSEEVAKDHGKSVINFGMKCKLCSNTNSTTILKDSIKSYSADDDEGNFKTMVVFDCRGMEPTDFQPRDGWLAKTTDGGSTFNDVDLTSGDWADYCDKINLPVSIGEIEHKFIRMK